MALSSSSITAGDVMDRAAVLMNDPAKTDYTYIILSPFLRMALDELIENLVDGHNAPLVSTSLVITVPAGSNAMYSVDSLNEPHYPSDLAEIQEISERLAGSRDPFIPMKRTEFLETKEAGDRLAYWTWQNQVVRFNPNGATTAREVQLNYLRTYSSESANIPPESIVGPINSRSFLSYKTAAYAAQFIGENTERAQILDAKAELALERIESINNKGKQQIMTRHRPFRANWKARGGF